jgi:hypothetical protein
VGLLVSVDHLGHARPRVPHDRRRYRATCHPPPAGQIPLTRNEIAALFGALVIDPVKDARYRLRWSAWRRTASTAPGPATTSGKPGNHDDQSRPA